MKNRKRNLIVNIVFALVIAIVSTIFNDPAGDAVATWMMCVFFMISQVYIILYTELAEGRIQLLVNALKETSNVGNKIYNLGRTQQLDASWKQNMAANELIITMCEKPIGYDTSEK